MEEAAWLVHGHTEGTMAYTEDRLTGTEGAGEPGNTVCAGGGAPAGDNESGELLDPCDASALENFHEDAIRQAGCGLAQVRVVLACGLGVCGATLELASVPFILPSAEIELCILAHEKNWLVLISLVGCAIGSGLWGGLGSRVGRRRALVSALAVNALFAAVAAFMPTYGTFMMARFCSAIGSGGIVPTSYTYTHEVCARGCRPRALACLVAASGLGAFIASALAAAHLPQTGASTLHENKEHFSAWHRYLLLCILPILASLVSLIWTAESPRYLLEVGREVDACNVYQSIHSSNQVRICGKGNVGAAGGAGAYRLSELALPGKSRHNNNTQRMMWASIFQMFSNSFRRTTLCLGGILLFTTAIQFYLSSYVPVTVLWTENEIFEASKRTVQNVSLINEHYNTTLENVHYTNVTFTNCTFRDMLLSHVQFKNCSFYDVTLSNIKTSYTHFGGCLFVNSTIIDTELEVGNELDSWCVLNGTVIRGMQASCAYRASLTSRLGPAVAQQSYVAHATLIAAVLALLPQKLRPMVVLCGCLLLLSPAIYIAEGETALYIMEGAYRIFLTLIFFGVACEVVETYPANVRCTALGMMLSLSYTGAAITRGAGGGGALLSCLLCALLALPATLLALR